jgi:hypothetical protein
MHGFSSVLVGAEDPCTDMLRKGVSDTRLNRPIVTRARAPRRIDRAFGWRGAVWCGAGAAQY